MIIGVVIAVALTLYALVDAAMTDGSRARGVNKPVWIVIIAVLPVIGALLWFFIGKGSARAQTARRPAPDDDPRFSGTRLSSSDLDAHMRDLEDRLRELDDETFPGEERTSRSDAAGGRAKSTDPQDTRSPGAPGDADPGADAANAANDDTDAAAPGAEEPGTRSDDDAKS
ncbi:PLD nuclease N-terminal domain-containing protein [Leucobacter sp. USCH14]|uniref:PLD nuclease N-terminal domain-containing protein n=1 Tax=Leucobacter sp. USCH14 TaxID=3024838 RepID=UPI0030A7B8F4